MSRPFSYDRYDTRRRPVQPARNSTLGYWVPLVITVTLAAGGIAAWVWSTRDDHESTDHDVTSDDENLSYGEEARAARERYGRDPRPGNESTVSEGIVRDDEYVSGGRNGADDGFVGGLQRGVQEAMRRTPSPAQAYDSVKKFGAAGIAAAGAAVGGALSAIREESADSRDRRGDRRGEEGFSDHERWSEEAEKRVVSHADQSRDAVSANVAAFGDSLRSGPTQYTGGRRKMVAIVLSSEVMLDQLQDEDGKYHSEHAVSTRHSTENSVPILTAGTVTPLTSPAHQPLHHLRPNPHLQPQPLDGQDSSPRSLVYRLLLRRHQHTRPNTRRGTHLPRSATLHTHRDNTCALCPLVRR